MLLITKTSYSPQDWKSYGLFQADARLSEKGKLIEQPVKPRKEPLKGHMHAHTVICVSPV